VTRLIVCLPGIVDDSDMHMLLELGTVTYSSAHADARNKRYLALVGHPCAMHKNLPAQRCDISAFSPST